MKIRYGLIILIICFIIVGIEGQSHQNKMNTYFKEKGEAVLSIDQKTFNHGPYFLVGKGEEIYEVKLENGNACWVKFGFTNTEYRTLDKDGNLIDTVKD